MESTTNVQCKYEHWWKKRRLETSHAGTEKLTYDLVLPLPSIPPALELNHDLFMLPPLYAQSIDIEKAVFTTSTSSSTINDASTIYSPTFSAISIPKVKVTQEPLTPPAKRCIRASRHLQYTICSVYRRLFTLVFVLNSVGGYCLLRKSANHKERLVDLDSLATLASSNFLLAILVRQDYFINVLFRNAWLVPWYVPLGFRKFAARVYCYGGIHSGAAVAGTTWWIGLTGAMSWIFVREGLYTFPVVFATWVIFLLLTSILLLALPKVRTKHHDTFEMTHRFLGWISIALFWTQLLLLTHHTAISTSNQVAFGHVLEHNPTFWNLTIMTLLLIYPWLRLRCWTFTAYPLSAHALRLSFPNAIHKFSCLSISSSPVREWHPFATFPSLDPNNPSTSIIISDAGDWTRNLIRKATMRHSSHTASTHDQTDGQAEVDQGVKMRFWVKSHPKAGVLSLSCLFPRVLIVTTGSGIGPSLSSLLDRPPTQLARLVWSTRVPLRTYGAHVLELVQKADPDALVIDTSEMGRPDLLAVSWGMYKEMRAEAVFVLSNEKVTTYVVQGLEARGVPAFGPIWDS